MRHRVAGRKLGRTSSHRKAMLRNLITSLILNDRVETTLPKAKELRKWADYMVTMAKKNTLHARRQAMMFLRNQTALTKLFSTLVDRYNDRAGGYTRILKLGFRHGDTAPMAIVEYLTAEMAKTTKATKGARKADGRKEKVAPKAKKPAEKSGKSK